MPDLKQAVGIVIAVVIVLVIMLLGDYFGHKFGRMKLLASLGFVALAVVIVFVLYAFVYSYFLV